MNTKRVLLAILISIVHTKLQFAYDKQNPPGKMIGYEKEKNGVQGITEDRFSMRSFGLCVADGVGGSNIPSGYIADFLCKVVMDYFAQCRLEPSMFKNSATVAVPCPDKEAEWSVHLRKHIDRHINAFDTLLNMFAKQVRPDVDTYEMIGSTTLVAVQLRQDKYNSASALVFQRGDSLLLHIQPTRIQQEAFYFNPTFILPPGQIEFNFPYQFQSRTSPEPSSTDVDEIAKVDVKRNDFILAGSDGFYDNLFLSVITYCVNYLILALQEHYLGRMPKPDPETVLDPVLEALVQMNKRYDPYTTFYRKIIAGYEKETINLAKLAPMSKAEFDEQKADPNSHVSQHLNAWDLQHNLFEFGVISRIQELQEKQIADKAGLAKINNTPGDDEDALNNGKIVQEPNNQLIVEKFARTFKVFQDKMKEVPKQTSRPLRISRLTLSQARKEFKAYGRKRRLPNQQKSVQDPDEDIILQKGTFQEVKLVEPRQSLLKYSQTQNKAASATVNQRESVSRIPSSKGSKPISRTEQKNSNSHLWSNNETASTLTSASQDKSNIPTTLQILPIVDLDLFFEKCSMEDLLYEHHNKNSFSDCVTEAISQTFSFHSSAKDVLDEFIDPKFISDALASFTQKFTKETSLKLYPFAIDSFKHQFQFMDFYYKYNGKEDDITVVTGFVVESDSKKVKEMERLRESINSMFKDNVDQIFGDFR